MDRASKVLNASVGSLLAAVIAAVGLSGCAAGNKAPVTVPKDFQIAAQVSEPIALGVRDRREDVVGGDDKETIVGHQRSLYGIPFAVQNASGKPFASDLAELIARGFREKGADVLVMRLTPFLSDEKAKDALRASQRGRLLLFDVIEWDADTYMETTLHYDVRLRVLNSDGEIIAESQVKGEDELKAKGRPERRTVSAATADILRELLEPRAIVAALSAASVETKRCSVDQILRMQESGLSQAQIEAACGKQ